MTPVSKHTRKGKLRPRKSFPTGTADGPKVAFQGVSPYAGKKSFVSMWRHEMKSTWRKLRKSMEKDVERARELAADEEGDQTGGEMG